MVMEQLELFGTCGRCGVEFLGGGEYCQACLEEAAVRYKAAYRRRRWLAGLCIDCGKAPACEGKTKCERCAAHHRAYGSQSRDSKRRDQARRTSRDLEAAAEYFSGCPLCGTTWPLQSHHTIQPVERKLVNLQRAGHAALVLWGRARQHGSPEERAARLRELETLVGLCPRCHTLVHDLGWDSEFPSFHAIDLDGYDAVFHSRKAEGVLFRRTGTGDWDTVSYIELRRHFWGQVERHIPGYKPPFYGPAPGLLHPDGTRGNYNS